MKSSATEVTEHARLMLAQLDAIRRLSEESRGLQGRRVRFASFPSVTSTILPGLLRASRRLHPGIEVVVLGELMRKLKNGLRRIRLILATGGCAVNAKSLVEQAGLHLRFMRC